MKFDKRFVLGAALILGLGMNLTACGDDDKKEDEDNTCKVTKESCEEQNKDFDKDKCECKAKEQSDDCGNGKLDEGEVCDKVDNEVKFAEGKGTCQLWYEENSDTETSPLVNDPEAVPGCASSCKAHSKGTCKTEAAVLCGNGKIDDGEVCDIGMDGQAKTEDDVVTGKTCKDYDAEVSWKEGGIPSCAKDCKNFGKGTCVEEGATTGGVSKCTAKATYNAENKKVTAEVTVDSESEYTTSLLCATNSNKLAAALDGTLSGSNEFDASAFTDAGDYSCIVVVVADDKKQLCSENGELRSVGGDIQTFADAAVGSFKIESQVSADTIAKWTFVSLTKDAASDALAAGVAPDEGSASALKLSFVKPAEGISVTMTADKASNPPDNVSLTALQVKPNKEGLLGDTQKADESSHLSIADLSGYSISSVTLSAKYEGAKIYITEVANEAESVIKTIDATADFADYEATGFTSGAKEINIYGDNSSKKAMTIDDITLVGAAK
ncbi:MAG: hypothetical protein IJU23_08445 [Proteobacteria bacterium]|nr:hypothetical protein [Pseudomonadota bacterium]